MIFVYIGLNLIPIIILFLKIKNKEFDEPLLFLSIIIWFLSISILWYYMDWYTFEGWDYEPQIWKN